MSPDDPNGDPTAEPSGKGVVLLPDEAATAALGRTIGIELEPGDLVALHGPIGAGKTMLARAVLRARLGQPDLDAPSPTFTLVQTYDGPRGPVIHADLYRIAHEGELVELGLDAQEEEAALVVEWPERAPGLLDRPRLDVALSIEPEGGRRAVLSGAGPLVDRLDRTRALEAMLTRSGWGGAVRLPMSGDASSRLYQRLERPGKRAVLMISPPRPDGPAVRRGKPYSAIARLAESVHAFVALDRGLIAQGFSAPAILAEDLDAGLLLLEDLGPEVMVDASGPIPDRYAEAIRCLAALHERVLPTTLPVAPRRDHEVPPYDLDAMLIEVELLLDWYLPHVVGTEPPGSVRAEFGHAWREALAPVLAGPQTWTLRDYHSPNLIWLPGRAGIKRVGLLDFQDAVVGPPSYDVASLLQDARVDVPPDLELRLLGLYASIRRGQKPDEGSGQDSRQDSREDSRQDSRQDSGFDTAAFAASYAVMAAQRATKILGIFARLDRRDGKPHYLRHLPRIAAYLRRDLDHPALARLRRWCEAHMPAAFASDAPPAGSVPDEPSA